MSNGREDWIANIVLMREKERFIGSRTKNIEGIETKKKKKNEFFFITSKCEMFSVRLIKCHFIAVGQKFTAIE